jgi:excisionase family DNA binding protein
MIPASNSNGRSLLINDAAVLLGVSRRTVYYRIRQGRLDTVRTRGGSQRVLLASIEQLLHRERHAALDERCQRRAAGLRGPDAGA